MRYNRPVDSARRDQILMEAAARRSAVVLTCKHAGQWISLKSRFLAAHLSPQQLVVEYPAGQPGQRAPDIEQGQNVGLAFRRGHKKCVFASVVAGKDRLQIDPHSRVGALLLRWPEQIHELQRRSFFRAAVPPGQTIAVYLWPGGAAMRSRAGSSGWPVCTAELLDLSAGGFRVQLLASDEPGLAVGQTVGMEFAPDPASPPIVADANLRHRQRLDQQRISMGFQFVGLEQTARGRMLLQRLGRIASNWRRCQFDQDDSS